MKLYDCFLFNGELDLLEIRLNIMSDYVDKFVILESEETFSGLSKPLYLDLNQSRYEKFTSKIEYLVAPAPESIPCPWSRESYYRNCLFEGIKSCSVHDYIMLSDLDWIPDPEKLYYYITRISDPFTLLLRDHLYYLNCKFLYNPDFIGTVIARKQVINDLYAKWDKSYYGMSDVGFSRLCKIRGECIQIPLAGWHYRNVFCDEDISIKLKSFSHYEANTLEINNLENIKKCKSELKNINPSCKQDKVEKYELNTNNTHKYIIDNIDKYKKYICQ